MRYFKTIYNSEIETRSKTEMGKWFFRPQNGWILDVSEKDL